MPVSPELSDPVLSTFLPFIEVSLQYLPNAIRQLPMRWIVGAEVSLCDGYHCIILFRENGHSIQMILNLSAVPGLFAHL